MKIVTIIARFAISFDGSPSWFHQIWHGGPCFFFLRSTEQTCASSGDSDLALFFGRKNVGDFFRKSQVTVGRHCWDLCPDPESDKADKVTEVGWVGRWDHRNIQELELDGTGVIEGFQDMFPFWVLVDNLRDKSLSLLLCMSRMFFFFFNLFFSRVDLPHFTTMYHSCHSSVYGGRSQTLCSAGFLLDRLQGLLSAHIPEFMLPPHGCGL